MDTIELRGFSKLDYREPRSVLVELRNLEIELAQSNTPRNTKNLRTNILKSSRELREAALFCQFMGERLGRTVYFSQTEAQDYDFVALHEIDGTSYYTKIQLKELVPEHVSRPGNLDKIIASLQKYTDSNQLCVAIHINRAMRFEPTTIHVPRLNIGSLWMFSALNPEMSEWALWGDFLTQPAIGSCHSYPT